MSINRAQICCAELVCMLVLMVGCRSSQPTAPSGTLPAGAATASAPPTQNAPPVTPLTPAQLAQVRPNEVGVVPILEYHAIDAGNSSFDRSPALFRNDLKRLYDEGYRPISLSDYLANHIDTPPGKSPVVLTFDDARESQFRLRTDGSTDADCAFAILQQFHRTHPDFAVKATFYVLPLSAFGPAAQASAKLETLLRAGCEIGNHTVTHRSLRRMSDADVRQELATAVVLIHKLAPEARVETIALPMGIAPKNRALLAEGEYQGQRYLNRAVLLVGANPAPSPISTAFNPMRLPRIQACEGPMGITYWLDSLKRHPRRRYVSDGDPKTVTVPASLAGSVDRARLNGAMLRTY